MKVILVMVGAIVGVLAEANAGPVSVADVDSVFSEWVGGGGAGPGPGCALGVIRDGRFQLEKGYGMANLEHGVPNSSRSVFRIGSVSKQFAAFAVLLADQQGLLDLDKGIRTYLPELPAVMEPVTVRHLIHHTSGIRDYLSLMSLAGRRDEDWYTEDDVMELLARQENLNFAPGTEYLYSNSGYFLLSQVLPRVAEMSLEQFSRTHVFEPLGMTETHFHDDFRRIVVNRAVGYRPREGEGYEIDVTTLNMVGDGGIFTSVNELLAWDRNFDTGEVGGESLRRERLVPGKFRDGSVQDYAAGLRVSTYRGLDVVHHSGAFVGYRAAMLRFPEKRFSAYVLCNSASATPSRYARDVAELYLSEEFPEPAPTPEPSKELAGNRTYLRSHAGLFWNELSGSLAEIEHGESGLLWKEEEKLLLPQGGGVFLAHDPNDPFGATRLTFDEGTSSPDSFVLSSKGQRNFTYRRVQPWTTELSDRVDYLGEYECRELGVAYRVELNVDDELALGTPTEALSLVDGFPDTFRTRSGSVAFERDDAGRVVAFELSWFRARNFRFVRR